MSRDMTQAQFERALERNGFKADELAGLWFEHKDAPNKMIGGIWDHDKGRLARRLTIARLLKQLKHIRAAREAGDRAG